MQRGGQYGVDDRQLVIDKSWRLSLAELLLRL